MEPLAAETYAVVPTIAMTWAAGTDHQSLAAMTGRPISTHAPAVRASAPLHRSPQTNLQTAASQWKILRQALFGGDFSVWTAVHLSQSWVWVPISAGGFCEWAGRCDFGVAGGPGSVISMWRPPSGGA